MSGMRDMFQQVILKNCGKCKENSAQNIMAAPNQLRGSQGKFTEGKKGELASQWWGQDLGTRPKHERM